MRNFIFAISVLFIICSSAAAGEGLVTWRSLAPGMDFGKIKIKKQSLCGDSSVVVVRIDPSRWEFKCLCTGNKPQASNLTARQWSRAQNMAVVINAGMYAKDFWTHVGYLRCGGMVNNRKRNPNYQSVAAFEPVKKGVRPFRIFDLDEDGVSFDSILKDYRSVIQNLRLIKHSGENRWPQQEKRWSEAALGVDSSGRVLLIFSLLPYSMHDLNLELLSSGMGLVAAQHLEGGPEAQIYINVGGFEWSSHGVYETTFKEDCDLTRPWPVPNVLGVRAREYKTESGEY